MENEDGPVVITYNGEIYNFPALRPALEQQGHRFRTRSDTETIVHHYEQHGEAGVAALDGMFAFAIWDARGGRLMLARDRCGIKPLYYAELPDGGLVFASELTAVLAHGGVDRALGAEGLASYFFSDYVHPPHTIVARGEEAAARAHARLGARPAAGAARVLAGADAPARRPRRRRRAGRAAVAGDRARRSRRSSSPTCRWASSSAAASTRRAWRRPPRGAPASA